jgi:tRNA pseudouridine38-40 synthase
MTRIALGIEYDGTDFLGWQSQRAGRTVQSVLETAVAEVAAGRVTIRAAGRTDTGVHAAQQVVHFDSRADRTERQWLLGINTNLPDDVSVSWAKRVADAFDARGSAVSRRYRYLISQGESPSALNRRRTWWVRRVLDTAAMTAAAVRLLGENDFSSFRAAGCQSRTPMRCLSSIEIHVHPPVLAIDFAANAFLYRMVRNLVGLLVEIGKGRLPPSRASELLERRDRRRAPATAPAAGLTLMGVAYPPEFGIPEPAEIPLVM